MLCSKLARLSIPGALTSFDSIIEPSAGRRSGDVQLLLSQLAGGLSVPSLLLPLHVSTDEHREEIGDDSDGVLTAERVEIGDEPATRKSGRRMGMARWD